MYWIQAGNLRVYRGWSWWQKLDNAHIPFLKIVFLMLTESNPKNFLSEIKTNNLKNYSKIFNVVFPKGSSVPFNLLCANINILFIIFMNFDFALFICLLFEFRPDIHSKTVNFFLSSESFITNETFVFLLNTW